MNLDTNLEEKIKRSFTVKQKHCNTVSHEQLEHITHATLEYYYQHSCQQRPLSLIHSNSVLSLGSLAAPLFSLMYSRLIPVVLGIGVLVIYLGMYLTAGSTTFATQETCMTCQNITDFCTI